MVIRYPLNEENSCATLATPDGACQLSIPILKLDEMKQKGGTVSTSTLIESLGKDKGGKKDLRAKFR